MKKLTQSLLSAGALLAATLSTHAADVKVAVVDLNKVYQNHYETVAEMAKLKAAAGKAQEDLDQMRKELSDKYDQYKALAEQVKNPAATADAQAKSRTDAEKLGQELQAKNADIQRFAQDAQNSLRQQEVNFHSLVIDEITKTATRIAQGHGATLLLDRNAITVAGTPSLLYADPSFDITDEVMAEILKNKPADAPTAPAAAAAAAPAPTASTPAAPSSTGDANSFTVPSVTPAK